MAAGYVEPFLPWVKGMSTGTHRPGEGGDRGRHSSGHLKNTAMAAAERKLPLALFPLQALWDSYVKVSAARLKRLPSLEGYEEIFWVGTHAVRRFDVLGTVVGCDVKLFDGGGALRTFSIDDGSDVIACAQWGAHQALPLGAVVRAWGRLGHFRGERQLTAFAVDLERDPHAEALRWLELEHLWREVYSRDLTARARAWVAPMQDADADTDAVPSRDAETVREALRGGAPVAFADLAQRMGGTDVARRACCGLRDDGLLEIVDDDTIATFDPRRRLVPAIVDRLRDGARSVADLAADLRPTECHRYLVNDARVQDAIDLLVEDSLVFEADAGTVQLLG